MGRLGAYYEWTYSGEIEEFGAPNSCPMITMMDPSTDTTVDTSGIYYINTEIEGPSDETPGLPGGSPPGARAIPSLRHDKYYGSSTNPTINEKNIPNPTVRTAFIGD